MNREVLAYKRISTMTRIENALNSVKGEARSCASLVRALWDTRRSRTALPGQGTTEYAILVGVFVTVGGRISGSAKTGDYLLVIAGVAAAVAAAAAAVAVVSRRKKGKHAKR